MLATRSILRACSVPRRTAYVCALKEKADPASAAKGAPKPKPAKPAKEPKAIRAPSAFNLFYKAMYHVVKEENPTADFAAVSTLVRGRWAEASAEVKAPYEKQAAELKAAVDQQKAAALAEKKANAKPLSAYMLFSQANRAAIVAANPGKRVTEVGSLLGQAWRALPAEEQQKYKDEAKRQMDAWKAKQGMSA